MKERPILFSAPMVLAILEGRKTQTRRIVSPRPQPHWALTNVGRLTCSAHRLNGENVAVFSDGEMGYPYLNRFGGPGDQLWVRETCRAEELPSGEDGVRYLADNDWRVIENTKTASEAWVRLNWYRGKRGATVPTIHMPRWASRINLEITGVRVERLQEISGSDCIAEGIVEADAPDYIFGLQEAYRNLWESINGPGSWDANPWVWVIEFRK